MCQNFKTSFLKAILTLIMLFFTVNLLYAQSNETPPRTLISEGSTSEEISSLAHGEYVKLPSNLFAPLSITIIDSQSTNPGHDMDIEWQSVVSAMGHTGTIMPQTTLDNTNFFSTTDILIISSGIIDIPTNRRDIIMQYIQQGGPVYLQGEYLCSGYDTGATFESIVNSLGGSFSWNGTVSGDLVPMNVLGTLSTTPNNVSSLSYFWYGCAGDGDLTIENYLEYGGQYFGFIFSPSNLNYGNVITNSDQDWVRASDTYPESRLLMENIITRLISVSSATLTISPPSGDYVTTQHFDLTLIVEGTGSATITNATWNGNDVTTDLNRCVRSGTLISGGETFRCPISGRLLGTGTQTFSATVEVGGSSVTETVTWEVLENSEP